MPERRRESAYTIRFTTRYAYDSEVADNMNALRVRPAVNPRQRVDEFSVRLSPEARQQRHEDYYGTEVVEFEVSRPHRALSIDVRTRVVTQPPPDPPSPSWSLLASLDYREAGGEFLFQTDDAPGHPVLEELLAATAGMSDPLSLVLAVAELIPSRFEYRRGATYVDSPLSAVLDGGAGVCQDFVHLGLCLLRHHGVAARYVSGYLFTTGGTEVSAGSGGGGSGSGEQSVEVDTHAWIEALLPERGDELADGEGAGSGGPEGTGGDSAGAVWVGVDPTNRILCGAQHVKIGHGRHYSDVPPIKGVYRGAASSELEASVVMTRLETAGSSPRD